MISNASPVFLKARTAAVPPNITVIAAGTANQMASWEKDKSHGLFTKYYLLGMAGAADAAPYGNGDGTVGYAELKRYFKKNRDQVRPALLRPRSDCADRRRKVTSDLDIYRAANELIRQHGDDAPIRAAHAGR